MESIQSSLEISFRQASPSELVQALSDARDYTLALFDCFLAAGLDRPDKVPRLTIVNPPLWELGHIAWFAEWYILREAESSHPDSAKRPSLLADADRWFDSNAVAHDARWSLDLPDAQSMQAYFREVHERVLGKLEQEGLKFHQLARAPRPDHALYPFRLVLAHEDMHGEAFAYTLQTLGVAAPPMPAWRAPAASQEPQGEIWQGENCQEEICFEGGSFMRGSEPDAGFVFDNEKWAHACEVKPFSMDAGLVTNARFAAFVEEGGYEDVRWWTPAGQDWLKKHGRTAPAAWQQESGQWLATRFGALHPLDAHEPVRHVSLHEVQAYCAWSKRRLPSEAEWEYAALSGNPAFRWGQLWEWTASSFEPYPCFAADAYREYSAPWFGTHQVLRGASFATPARMRSAKFRNFYLPGRNDIFAGFRTCAR